MTVGTKYSDRFEDEESPSDGEHDGKGEMPSMQKTERPDIPKRTISP